MASLFYGHLQKISHASCSNSNDAALGFLPRDAKQGAVMTQDVVCPSVHLSVACRYRDHTGWNTYLNVTDRQTDRRAAIRRGRQKWGINGDMRHLRSLGAAKLQSASDADNPRCATLQYSCLSPAVTKSLHPKTRLLKPGSVTQLRSCCN